MSALAGGSRAPVCALWICGSRASLFALCITRSSTGSLVLGLGAAGSRKEVAHEVGNATRGPRRSHVSEDRSP
eukprot:3467827-Prymnesium_polylepis.1